jgi:hypothetical protein
MPSKVTAPDTATKDEWLATIDLHKSSNVLTDLHHHAAAAELLGPCASHETYEIVRTHQDFQGRSHPDSRQLIGGVS